MDHGVGSSDPFVLLKFVTVPAFSSEIIRAVFSVFCCGGDWIIRNRLRFFPACFSLHYH